MKSNILSIASYLTRARIYKKKEQQQLKQHHNHELLVDEVYDDLIYLSSQLAFHI